MLVYDTLFGNDDDQQAAAADGRQVRDQRGPAHLHVHAARRAEVPRRLAGHHQGRDRLAQALGARKDGVGQRLFSLRRQAGGGRRQDLPHGAEASPTAWCSSRSARAARSVAVIMREKEALTDPQQQVKEVDRLGPVQVRQGPMGAGQQGGLSQEHRLRAAARQRARRRPSPAPRSRASTASSWSGSPIRRPRCRRWSTARSTSTRTRTSTSCRSWRRRKRRQADEDRQDRHALRA